MIKSGRKKYYTAGLDKNGVPINDTLPMPTRKRYYNFSMADRPIDESLFTAWPEGKSPGAGDVIVAEIDLYKGDAVVSFHGFDGTSEPDDDTRG